MPDLPDAEAPAVDTPDARRLRATMVNARGAGRRPAADAAMRKVPRHLFVPDAAVEDAYDPDSTVITHWFEDGTALSCASGPFAVATMLDHLDLKPGSRARMHRVGPRQYRPGPPVLASAGGSLL